MQRNLDCAAQLKKLLAMEGSKPQLKPGAFDDIVKQGVNSDALKAALDGLNNAVKQGIIKNPHSFVVTDYSKKSGEPRMHIITLDAQGRAKVESVKTSHGKGSDLDNDGMMDCFNSGSGEQGTPRGAHVTGGTYDGKHGNSLRLHGLDKENANTCSRAVVIHKSEYIAWPTPGRSYGCPALDPAVCEDVINTIQGGTFVYHYGRQPDCK
jgi:hypothetical protein